MHARLYSGPVIQFRVFKMVQIVEKLENTLVHSVNLARRTLHIIFENPDYIFLDIKQQLQMFLNREVCHP